MSTRPPPPGGEYSAASIPMRVRKQPRSSRPPVNSAICGMSPSLRVLGSRAVPAEMLVVPQSFVPATVIMRRHLPICMTRGTLFPVGTPVSLNEPSAPVNANVT